MWQAYIFILIKLYRSSLAHGDFYINCRNMQAYNLCIKSVFAPIVNAFDSNERGIMQSYLLSDFIIKPHVKEIVSLLCDLSALLFSLGRLLGLKISQTISVNLCNGLVNISHPAYIYFYVFCVKMIYFNIYIFSQEKEKERARNGSKSLNSPTYLPVYI